MLVKPKVRKYWKLSMYNAELDGFLVVAVCLTKRKAEKLLQAYQSAGRLCRISPHIRGLV